MGEAPLEGITVLDLGQIYNGPYCGYLLAMAGARVIKVEPPTGEGMRGRGGGGLASYPFMMLNGNKETVTLNLKDERGRDLLKRLVKHADVLLENFSPGTMERNGVGSDTLLEINPRLIYGAATGFGRGGPHCDYRAMDITVQAMTGVVAITGNDDEPPLKSGPALWRHPGWRASLRRHHHRPRAPRPHRQGRGPGRGHAGCGVPHFDICPRRLLRRRRQSAANRQSPSGNGRRALQCLMRRQTATWRSSASGRGTGSPWCRLWARPELLEDPRFESMKERSRNMAATDEAVEAWTSSLPKDEVFRICQQHDVICAPVQSLDDVLNDPHLLERGALAKLAHERYGHVTLPSTALRFEDVDPPPVTLPRHLGADNESIYGDLLGLTRSDLDELTEAGSI